MSEAVVLTCIPHSLPLMGLDQWGCQVGRSGRGHIDGSKLLQPREKFPKDSYQLGIVVVKRLTEKR